MDLSSKHHKQYNETSLGRDILDGTLYFEFCDAKKEERVTFQGLTLRLPSRFFVSLFESVLIDYFQNGSCSQRRFVVISFVGIGK